MYCPSFPEAPTMQTLIVCLPWCLLRAISSSWRPFVRRRWTRRYSTVPLSIRRGCVVRPYPLPLPRDSGAARRGAKRSELNGLLPPAPGSAPSLLLDPDDPAHGVSDGVHGLFGHDGTAARAAPDRAGATSTLQYRVVSIGLV